MNELHRTDVDARRHRTLPALALLLVALNLRPAVASIGAVLPDITRDLALSSFAASALTTIPVLTFGLFGLAAAPLARALGAERTLFFILLLLVGGVGLRGIPATSTLFIGQAFACISIGVCNVLLPPLMKRDFPQHLALITGAYTMALCVGAAAGAAASVPLANALHKSWSHALAAWALPAALATMLWLTCLRPSVRGSKPRATTPAGDLWRDPLAWQVTLFMGLQSALAFTVFGWFPPMLRDRGLGAEEAGYALSISVLVQAAAALVAPLLATRGKDQRFSCVLAVGLCAAGLLGCLFAPLRFVWFWTVILGVAQGSLFALALMLIVLRAPTTQSAAHLSSMVQGIGYSIAATGPLFSGLIRGWTGSWNSVAVFWLVIAAGAALCAMGAGRPIHVRSSAGSTAA